MARKFGAFIAGLLSGILIQALVEALGHAIYPPPAALLTGDREALQAYLESAPIFALLFPLLAVFSGSFMGGLIASALGRASLALAILIGGLFTLGSIINLVLLPHPVWITIAYVLLPLPAAILGNRLMSKRST